MAAPQASLFRLQLNDSRMIKWMYAIDKPVVLLYNMKYNSQSDG